MLFGSNYLPICASPQVVENIHRHGGPLIEVGEIAKRPAKLRGRCRKSVPKS